MNHVSPGSDMDSKTETGYEIRPIINIPPTLTTQALVFFSHSVTAGNSLASVKTCPGGHARIPSPPPRTRAEPALARDVAL